MAMMAKKTGLHVKEVYHIYYMHCNTKHYIFISLPILNKGAYIFSIIPSTMP